MRKTPEHILDWKVDNLKKLIRAVVAGEIDTPDDCQLVDAYDMKYIYTKKRLELVDLIEKSQPQSITDLVKLTGRRKQAINRDLRFLERHKIMMLDKKGRIAKPILVKKIFIMPANFNGLKHANGKRAKDGEMF